MIAAVAASFGASLFAADKAELTNTQKASYAIGVNMGRSFKQQGLQADIDQLVKGYKDAQAGSVALQDSELQEAMMNLQKEMLAAQAAKGEKAKTEGAEFLAANKSKEGVKTTASGLQYKVIKEGTGAKPKATDTVVAHYRGTYIDGTEFDSSYKRGEPTEFPLSGVIKGWTEGLQLMSVGSKYQFFIPAELAYGTRTDVPVVPNSTLIFEVELVNVKPGEDGAAPNANPAGAPGGKK